MAVFQSCPSCRSGGIGRRTGLKIQRWQQRAGSIPASGTTCYNLNKRQLYMQA